MISKSSGTRQRVIKLNNISKSLSKAPSVLTAIACIVSFAMLVTLLLFQGGILYSMGLTMLTSDILVTAITIVLAVCAILSLAAMIRSMVANKKNKKLIHNIIADVEGSKEAEKTASPAPVQAQEDVKKESTPAVSDTSSDDDEPEEANGESIPEVVTTAANVTPDTKDSDKKIVGSVVSKGMDEPTLETLDKLMEQNNEKDMTPPVVVAPAIQPAMQEKAEQASRNYDAYISECNRKSRTETVEYLSCCRSKACADDAARKQQAACCKRVFTHYELSIVRNEETRAETYELD